MTREGIVVFWPPPFFIAAQVSLTSR